jgi:hypothetical protein
MTAHNGARVDQAPNADLQRISDPATAATVPGRGQSLLGGSDVNSEHHDHKPASLVEQLRDEITWLSEQLDDARDAVAPLAIGLNQLTTAVRDWTQRRRNKVEAEWLRELHVAADWLRELLVLPVSRLDGRDQLHLYDLQQELRSILDAVTAALGIDDDTMRRGDG